MTHTFTDFFLASLLINLIPGNDRVFVVSATFLAGKREGVFAALGISTGIFIHSLFGAFGLAAVIQAYPPFFAIIRIAGIAFLFILGLMYLLPSRQPDTERKITRLSLYGQGLMVHLLNPMAIIFSFTFLPQFIDPNDNFAAQFIVLSLFSNILSLGINAMTAILISFIHSKIKIDQKIIRITSGLILIGLAVRLCFA